MMSAVGAGTRHARRVSSKFTGELIEVTERPQTSGSI
jgi:hypothetical protein